MPHCRPSVTALFYDCPLLINHVYFATDDIIIVACTKARYTVTSKLNSTQSTLLKIDKVSIWLHIGDKVDRIGNKVHRVGDSLERDREFKLLPIWRQNRQQSRPYRRQSTLLPICRRFRQHSTLSPVCTRHKSKSGNISSSCCFFLSFLFRVAHAPFACQC